MKAPINNPEQIEALQYEIMHLLHMSGIIPNENVATAIGINTSLDIRVVFPEGEVLYTNYKELVEKHGRSDHLCLEFYGEL